jgi:hypothetical protein
MKQPLKSRRPTPAEALAVAAETAPTLPPAQMPPPADRPATITMRLRTGTIAALTATARERGQTIKQVVAHALAGAGVAVASAGRDRRC